MTELKRIPIKYLRDYLKKNHKVKEKCYICGSTEKLEEHHLFSLAELFGVWCKNNNITDEHLKDFDTLMDLRIKFEQDTRHELSFMYTLCELHHDYLHNLFGQRYPNSYSTKVSNWIEIQRKKYGIS